MRLYDYFRSSASYRVRIALHLKGLDADIQEVHLVNHGGEQHLPAYQTINPQELVPSLEIGDEVRHQSLAMLEYLDEKYPTPPILPSQPLSRAHARSIAYTIACDIHPLNNLRILNYLKSEMQQGQEAVNHWYAHWITLGFQAIEKKLAQMDSTEFCVGSEPSLADICLVPQVYNAHRFDVPMSDFPRIEGIVEHCMRLPAFVQTAPEHCESKAT